MSDQKDPVGDIFQTRYREVTVSAILFAIGIGIVMNAAITYAGLKIGFTIGGSAIAAVLGFGVLRGVLRRGSILETNIAQTCASAVNTSNAGIIFTVPVLFLLGLPLAADSADFWLITLAAVGGSILGAAFIIPLRKQMIEIDRLRFPTGTGVAIGTLVERTTRFTMLLHLPRIADRGRLRVKNGLALAGHGAEAVRDAITSTLATLPDQLRRSLTWDQGAEMAQARPTAYRHWAARLLLRPPQSVAARHKREHQRPAAPVLPQRY